MTPHTPGDVGAGALHRLRRLLLALVLFGALGLLAELLLLEHWEAGFQRAPLILLGLTALGSLALLARPERRMLRAFQAVMVIAVLSGVAGTAFHFGSNVQLEREIGPDRPGGEIFRAAVGGGTPTLAPGAMIQLGLLGLLATYRHPAGARRI